MTAKNPVIPDWVKTILIAIFLFGFTTISNRIISSFDKNTASNDSLRMAVVALRMEFVYVHSEIADIKEGVKITTQKQENTDKEQDKNINRLAGAVGIIQDKLRIKNE